jgi:hypothetical protein
MPSKIEAQQLAAFRVDVQSAALSLATSAVLVASATSFTTRNTLIRKSAARARAKRVIPNALARCTP